MLDIKFIRENSELVKQGILNKNAKDTVDDILKFDKQKRELLQQAEELKAVRNKVSQEVGRLKKTCEPADEIIAEMKAVGEKIKSLDDEIRTVDKQLKSLLMWVPNLPHKSVPIGKSEADNVEVKQWLPDGFSFEMETKPLDNVELGKKIGRAHV